MKFYTAEQLLANDKIEFVGGAIDSEITSVPADGKYATCIRGIGFADENGLLLSDTPEEAIENGMNLRDGIRAGLLQDRGYFVLTTRDLVEFTGLVAAVFNDIYIPGLFKAIKVASSILQDTVPVPWVKKLASCEQIDSVQLKETIKEIHEFMKEVRTADEREGV